MNQIIRGLWIGGMVDAKHAPAGFHILSVMWQGEPGQDYSTHFIQTTDYKDQAVFAVPEKMNEAADWIEEKLSKGEEVLVHCAYGIERSPLTVVWYLMKHRSLNLRDAYDHVLEVRKEAQYRGGWLPIEVREKGVIC